MEPVVEIRQFQDRHLPAVTSLDLAEALGREHSWMLRKIQGLKCSENFWNANFGRSFHLDGQGKRIPVLVMTRAGFTLLADSLEGGEADRIKDVCLREFDRREAELAAWRQLRIFN